MIEDIQSDFSIAGIPRVWILEEASISSFSQETVCWSGEILPSKTGVATQQDTLVPRDDCATMWHRLILTWQYYDATASNPSTSKISCAFFQLPAHDQPAPVTSNP